MGTMYERLRGENGKNHEVVLAAVTWGSSS